MAEKHEVNDVPVLRRAAMDFLARREHSFFELQQKLRRRFPDCEPDLLDQVISGLRNEGLQSDARFAESWIRYRRSKGFGYLHIRQDLESRAIASDVIEEYLCPDDDWAGIAAELVVRKLGDGNLEFGGKQHRRILRYLQSRGFNQREIRKVLDHRLVSASRPSRSEL